MRSVCDNNGVMLPLRPLLILLLLSACAAPDDIRDSRFIMGTLVEFTISGADQEQAFRAISAAANEMQRIEDEFTIYGDRDNSVKRFNATPVGKQASLPDEVSDLLKVALQIQKESRGAFNPALGKLNKLWGFSQAETPVSPPTEHQIEAAIPPALCFQQQRKQWIRLDERCQLDFGAIAKGYAIDQGINILRSHNIHNAVINAGGDIRLIGSHGERPWRIGIRHPRNKGDVIKALELEGDVAVVTSGDYERFYIYQDKRYHHILNPETGWPASSVQSSTVIAENAMLADAWSTARFVMGNQPVKGFNKKCLMIDYRGQMTTDTL